MKHPVDVGIEIAKFHCPMYRASATLSLKWSYEALLALRGREEGVRILQTAHDAMHLDWTSIDTTTKTWVLFGVAFVGYMYRFLGLDASCMPMLLVDLQRAMGFQAESSTWKRAFDVADKLYKEMSRTCP